MSKKVKIFVRSTLWQEMYVDDNSDHISFSIYSPDITSYQDYGCPDPTVSFETINVPIQKYQTNLSDPYEEVRYSEIEYRATIDDPNIVIYDKINITRVNINSPRKIIDYFDPTPIKTRFEILDL